MSGRRCLVDVTVPMARSFEEEDDRNPAGVTERRRAAARRMLENGFTKEEVAKLYGDASGTAPRSRRIVEEVPADYPMAAFLRR